MERRSEGRKKLRIRRTPPEPTLGFFLFREYPQDIPPTGSVASPIKAQFIYISKLGKELKEGGWGNLDDSLSFLIATVPEEAIITDDSPIQKVFIDIDGSSNGFLLCCRRNTGCTNDVDYIVCNPVTREYRYLPRPSICSSSSFGIAIAFICQRGSSSLDEVHYEVIQGAMDLSYTTLYVETFSSVSNTWTIDKLVPEIPIAFGTRTTPCVIGEVIYWKVWARSPSRSAILAYDRAARSVKLIDFPWNAERECFGCGNVSGAGQMFGASEGRLQYAWFDPHKIEMWAMETSSDRWVMKHQMEVDWFNVFSEVTRGWELSDYICFVGFHPHHSDLLLLTFFNVPYWWDLERKKLTEIRGGHEGHEDRGFEEQYFPYEWPLPLSDRYIFPL